MEKPQHIIYKPIVTSQDMIARVEAVKYLEYTYGMRGIKPEMMRFRIADDNGEPCKQPGWELDLESYLKEREQKSMFRRVIDFFKKK